MTVAKFPVPDRDTTAFLSRNAEKAAVVASIRENIRTFFNGKLLECSTDYLVDPDTGDDGVTFLVSLAASHEEAIDLGLAFHVPVEASEWITVVTYGNR